MSDKTRLPETLRFLSATGRSLDHIRHYHVVDRKTGEPIGLPIVWADADLGVFAHLEYVETPPGTPETIRRLRQTPNGRGALKTLVHRDIAIVRRPTIGGDE